MASWRCSLAHVMAAAALPEEKISHKDPTMKLARHDDERNRPALRSTPPHHRSGALRGSSGLSGHRIEEGNPGAASGDPCLDRESPASLHPLQSLSLCDRWFRSVPRPERSDEDRREKRSGCARKKSQVAQRGWRRPALKGAPAACSTSEWPPLRRNRPFSSLFSLSNHTESAFFLSGAAKKAWDQKK